MKLDGYVISRNEYSPAYVADIIARMSILNSEAHWIGSLAEITHTIYQPILVYTGLSVKDIHWPETMFDAQRQSNSLYFQTAKILELLKDYDLIIDFHLGKPSVIIDALSRKSLFVLQVMNTRLLLSDNGLILVEYKAKPMFLQQNCEA
ncbi:RNA-directed DNA polymerase-like protein [Gossypium australe]|uniref:RNA-directed DNA polymerase-like protein n=1 Tax=Gossypium australe TaxID=47621 RepID=A0A5B6VM48_9ROSI|nr:RNA-directed DNA polymerase-like protein [Gossypium australe]